MFPEHISVNIHDGEKLMGTQGGNKDKQSAEAGTGSWEGPYWGDWGGLNNQCSQERKVRDLLRLGENLPVPLLD